MVESIFFGIILVVLFLLLLEVTFRVWDRFFTVVVERKDYYSPAYAEYMDYYEKWNDSLFEYVPVGLRVVNRHNKNLPVGVELNALGFRCREFSDSCSEDVVVAILGGSAAWGCGATDNASTVAGVVEEALNSDPERTRSYKVYNLAQIKGFQTQDILTIVFLLSQIKPTLVVSLNGWNEVVGSQRMPDRMLREFKVFGIDEMAYWQPLGVGNNAYHMVKTSLGLWMSRRSRLFQGWCDWRGIEFNTAVTKARAPIRGIQAAMKVGEGLFLSNLERIVELNKIHEYRHLQVFQPYLYRKRNVTQYEKSVLNYFDEIHPVWGGHTFRKLADTNNIFSNLVSIIRGNKERYGNSLDCSDIFIDDTDERFYSLVHLNDVGYRIVGQRIFEEIKRTNLLPE